MIIKSRRRLLPQTKPGYEPSDWPLIPSHSQFDQARVKNLRLRESENTPAGGLFIDDASEAVTVLGKSLNVT